MRVTAWVVDHVTSRTKAVIAILLVMTLIVGAGAAQIEESLEMEMFDEEPDEIEAERFVEAEFSASPGNTTELLIVVQNEQGNVLERESLLESLEYQRTLLENETVNGTLIETNPVIGIENLVASSAYVLETGETGSSGDAEGILDRELPPLEAQIDQLDGMSDGEVQALIEQLLDPESELAATPEGERLTQFALDLLPRTYEPGSPDAQARLTIVTHQTDELVVSIPELPESVREAQVTAQTLAGDTDRDTYRMTGAGLLLVEEEQAIEDSHVILGPIALLFVLAMLWVAYRDIIDIILGLGGIILVLTWTFGAMGWLGIDFNLMMIAIPVLLIGLSIDYCIHVVMRYRECYTDSSGSTDGPDAAESPHAAVRPAMHAGLDGVAPALVLVTVTAMLGFLSIRTSGSPTIAAFSLATATGIFAALVIFGVLVPSLKIELDEWLATRGYDRTTRAFGTTGRLRRLLAGAAHASLRRPLTIVLVVLVVSSLGAAAGTQINSDFSQDDYIPEEAPAWTEHLPTAIQPAEYELSHTHEYLYANFQSPDQQVHIVAQGNVTNPETLARVAAAEAVARNTTTTMERPTGEAAITGPISAMQATAERNETFANRLDRADTTGDGVPDQNVSAVLTAFLHAEPERADQLLAHEDGMVTGLQVVVVVDGTDDPSDVVTEMEAVAATMDTAAVSVTLAGDPVVNELVQRQLSTTTVEGLAIALVAVLLVLAVAFRLTRGSATLGVVTLLPVLFALSWILGAMYLLGIEFSFMTAIIGSIAIGLGVDYAIHAAERYSHELERHNDMATALEESVVGTGGALLGSAVTTAGGFGVLAFSLVPSMQQFGILTALTLLFAFVASVLVLPSLLVLWTRLVKNRDVTSRAVVRGVSRRIRARSPLR